MENSSRIVVTLDPESVFDPDTDRTIISSRKYFNTGTLQSAQAVVPLTPGPAMVIPVRQGVSPRWLALVAVTALVCGSFGGWLIGQTRSDKTVEQNFSVTSPPVEAPAAETPPVAPLPETTAPALPESVETTAWMTQTERNGRKKPTMRAAKVTPKPSASPSDTPSAAPAEANRDSAPANGESRPRRARADGNNERVENTARDERPARNGRELNH